MFVMDKPQIEATKRLKDLLTMPVLKFYNPNSATRIKTDASSEGVGAMLEQNIEAEWYPSRSLRSNERNYAQIGDYICSIWL